MCTRQCPFQGGCQHFAPHGRSSSQTVAIKSGLLTIAHGAVLIQRPQRVKACACLASACSSQSSLWLRRCLLIGEHRVSRSRQKETTRRHIDNGRCCLTICTFWCHLFGMRRLGARVDSGRMRIGHCLLELLQPFGLTLASRRACVTYSSG